MSERQSTPLLEIEHLTVTMHGSGPPTCVVRGIDLSVNRGETLGIVGESGCGKSVSMLALAGLLPEYADVQARSVRWDGRPIGLDELHALRGEAIGFVFQDPVAAFNPLMPVGRQVAECLVRRGMPRRAAAAAARELLAEAGIDDPDRVAGLHPWELSGGMAQRALIAMALAPEPDLLVADEPTTAVDASARRHVLDLVAALQRARGVGVLLVSHDLAVVRSRADTAAVMYAGKLVEHGDAAIVTGRPRHPYTAALVACTLDPFAPSSLAPIDGEPPDPADLGSGCAFQPRCRHATAACDEDPPLLGTMPNGHSVRSRHVACWHPQEADR